MRAGGGLRLKFALIPAEAAETRPSRIPPWTPPPKPAPWPGAFARP